MTATRRSADERRIDVIQAAMVEFGTYGYYGGSTERIAATAEISQPYVLRLFGTKLKLFLATLDHVCDTVLTTWERELTRQPAEGWRALMVLGQSYAQGEDAAVRFRMIMQGAAAAETKEIETAINESMDRLWTWVKKSTLASDEDIQRFWAFGMMQTMAIAMNAPKYIESSDRARAMLIPPQE